MRIFTIFGMIFQKFFDERCRVKTKPELFRNFLELNYFLKYVQHQTINGDFFTSRGEDTIVHLRHAQKTFMPTMLNATKFILQLHFYAKSVPC